MQTDQKTESRGNRMNLIIGKRGSGKTTEIIKRSAETNTYILVMDETQRKFVVRMAKELGYNIPNPITVDEVKEYGLNGMFNKRLLIDDAEYVLQAFVGLNIEILGAAISIEDEVTI